ncbi:helix-turn-helix domain-containing protein [Aeromonas media]|uniref:helix-turn-helix domain-containing protein n=1 Tax=Aeromonas media TaxID=651 RepID=UPI0015FC2C12|nr:helix-turn-helix domain-containing protein [Aeromonas media]
MDSKTLIQAYMRAKNMTQLKEVAEALDLSPSYITEMNQGRREFTDKAAISIANELGLDATEVIISLTAVRARDPSVKAAWYDALKKYCASTGTALALGLMMIGSPNLAPDLTAHNVYYVKSDIPVFYYISS